MPPPSYRWHEGQYEVTRSICWSPPGCHGGCGVLLYSRDGKLVRVEGDESNPFNNGRLCVRGLNTPEALYHPKRLTKPLLRAGRKGENRWREIAFDDAIEIIAEKFLDIKARFAAESVIFCKGTARDIGGYLPRLCYGFGSPNYFGFGPGNGNACYRPRVAVSTALLGSLLLPDLGQFDSSGAKGGRYIPPKCILIWGANPIHSNPDGLHGGWVSDLMKSGTELIVVDPQRTWLASKAKHWLQIRPGTDAALALGMIHVLFKADLVDKDFCRDWVIGVDDIKAVANEYPPERAARIAGVNSEDVVAAAHFLAASKPANLIWGVSVDMNPGCLGTIQGLIALMALTGNIENPGGMILSGDPFGVKRRGDDLSDFSDVRCPRIGADRYPLIEIGNPYGQPDVLLDQMESGDPYPIKAAWLQGTGVIPSSFADPRRVTRLFSNLDFSVLVDVFLTPAAVAFADVVLPAAMYPEKDSIYVHFSQLSAINKAIVPPGQCRSDAEIILQLGRRIAPDYFPWEDIRQWLDYRLEPSGMNFAELRETGSLRPAIEYSKHDQSKLRNDRKRGFKTPSGKIELNSSVIRKMGLNPLPHFSDCLFEYQHKYGKDDYPFTLTTGTRKPYYFCAEHRHMASLRKLQPNPLVTIHPETGLKTGIKEGDTVRIFSPFGSCLMKAQISDRFAPDVIHCDFGWWFPEKKGDAPELFGVMQSNVNALLPSGLQGPGGLGYPFRCFICNIEKAKNR